MIGWGLAVAHLAGLWCAYRWGLARAEARPSVADVRRAVADLRDFYELAAAEDARATRGRGSFRQSRRDGQAAACADLLAFIDGDPEAVDRARGWADVLRGRIGEPLDPHGR